MSDHVPFADAGIPAFLMSNDLHADYHRPTDDTEALDVEDMRVRVNLLFLTLCELSNRDVLD